ncbi:MAG: sugar phosphate isomerase/epimerase [Kiritimatiellae bacterium]|nr:sugar phosphate isomerase/epimerase [Kiritimatiellia bacterium]
MKLGVNLLAWTARPGPAHRKLLRAARRAGADGVEVPVMGGRAGDWAAFGRLLKEEGLECTTSTAFTSPDANPADADVRRRRAALDALRSWIECAHALGASVLCGPMYQTLGCFSGRAPTAAELRRASDVLRCAAEDAHAAGVVLAVEPLNRFECHLLNTLAGAAAFVRLVGHPAVGIHFDTFHANIEEKNPAGAVRRYGRAIVHVHCSANDRGVPGDDHVDWIGVFRALKSAGYDGWLVIEAFSRALPQLAAATRVWRDLFGEPGEILRRGLPFVRRAWSRA